MNNFLLALQYQKTFMEMHKNTGTGLMRLVLNVTYSTFFSFFIQTLLFNRASKKELNLRWFEKKLPILNNEVFIQFSWRLY